MAMLRGVWQVLRVWFEADERIVTLRKLAAAQSGATPQALHESAVTAEYLLGDAQGAMADSLEAIRSGVTQHDLMSDAAILAIRFFEPVCAVLDGEERSSLDALPPEQRELALEVLAKFEPSNRS